jgi:hypothetical protein
MKTKRLVVCSLVVALVIGYIPRPAYAWNKPGHMVVAAIAYRDLQRTSNQARQMVSVQFLPNDHASLRSRATERRPAGGTANECLGL